VDGKRKEFPATIDKLSRNLQKTRKKLCGAPMKALQNFILPQGVLKGF
jgi:hypothetical protein